jgi:hypothetical protein
MEGWSWLMIYPWLAGDHNNHNPTGNPHQPTRIFHGMTNGILNNALISHRDCEPFEGWLNISCQDSKSSKVNAPFFDGRKKRHRRVTSFPHISTYFQAIFINIPLLQPAKPAKPSVWCQILPFHRRNRWILRSPMESFLESLDPKTAMVQDRPPWSGDAQGGDLGMSPWGNSAWGSNGK